MFNVLILGAGQIGAFYDVPADQQVLTHAHAISLSPYFNLLGFVDINITRAQAAAKIWGGKAATHWDVFFNKKSFEETPVDVIIVATPDQSHFELLKKIGQLNTPPKLVCCEKPLTLSAAKGSEIVSLFNEKKIPLTVNYSRRFLRKLQTIKERIKKGECGKFQGGMAFYGKGTKHNGSHMIDLIHFLLGDVESFHNINKIQDYADHDPSVSTVLYLDDKKTMTLQAVDSRVATVFELDLLFEKGRFKLFQHGQILEEYLVDTDKDYPAQQNFKLQQKVETGLTQVLLETYEHFYDFLTKKCELFSTGEESLKTIKLCEQIVSEAICQSLPSKVEKNLEKRNSPPIEP